MSIHLNYPTSSLAKARTDARDKYYAKIKPIIEELLDWGYGEKAIANALNAKGILTAHGKEYNYGTVKHLLRMLGYKEQ